MALLKIKETLKQLRFPFLLAVLLLLLPFTGLFIYNKVEERKRRTYDQVLKQPVVSRTLKIEPGKPFTNTVGMKFVHIPSGKFTMGSPPGELGRTEFEYQHEVVISHGFYLQTTEVTQKQWTLVMGKNLSKIIGDNHPVDQVSWLDTQKFIRRLNLMEAGGKYRLPTEAEWEYACRAGTTTAFSSGDISAAGSDHDPNLNRVGWYWGNSAQTSHPAAKKEPNAWGLYDMHGNVWEWSQDWYAGWYNKFTQGVAIVDPRGSLKGRQKVFRGGSWFSGAEYSRAADRMRARPDTRSYGIGFRVARSE